MINFLKKTITRQNPDASTGPASTPFSEGDAASEVVMRCPRWKIRLIDDEGNAMSGRAFNLTHPIAASGQLDSAGESPVFDQVAPSAPASIGLTFDDFKVLPEFSSLWAALPDLPWEDVVKQIGGDVESQANEYYLRTGQAYNACTLRISRAFNYASQSGRYFGIRHIQEEADPSINDPDNHAIPSGTINLSFRRLLGADGKAYGMRVSELEPYLERFYPDAAVTSTSAYSLAPFRTFKGVMVMDIRWEDATGHVAIWDGANFRRSEDDYFDPSKIGGGIYTGSRLFHSMEIVYLETEKADNTCTLVFKFRKVRNV